MNPQPSRPPRGGQNQQQQQLADFLHAQRKEDRRKQTQTQLSYVLIVAAVLGGGGWWALQDGVISLPTEAKAPEKLVEKAPVVVEKAPEVKAPAPTVEAKYPGMNSPTHAEETTAVAETPVEEKKRSAAAEKIDKEDVLVLTGMEAGRDKNLKRDADLLATVSDSQSWAAYKNLLSRSLTPQLMALAKNDGENRFEVAWKEPAMYQTFLRWNVLSHFDDSALEKTVEDAYGREMVTWLLNQPATMEELLLTLNKKDDSTKVMSVLKQIWFAGPDKAKKYFNLAIATSVVFDEPFEIRNVNSSNPDSRMTLDAVERYLWYVEKDEKGKLAAPMDRTSARDLVYVVCAPVPPSELDWAIGKMHLSRKRWGEAYGMVEYLMERAVKGLNPYDLYTFEEILDKGGICGDQSYFCANTARANGIPAMIFAGETDLGGHAWVALKIKPDEWSTEVGRIGGVSKGQTGNPQTGESLTEQEVRMWNDREHRSESYVLSVWRHLWVGDYFAAIEKPTEAERVAELANKIGKAFPETWARLYDVLVLKSKRAGEPSKAETVAMWKEFATSMRREFKDNPRMGSLAAKAETEHIFPYGEESDARRQLARERRRSNRDASEQTDLVADSLAREADLIEQRGGVEAKKDISRLYDRALRDYGGSITGFKMMSEDYFQSVKDDPTLAKKAVRDIELAFKRVVETGTKDWFRAKTETEIHQRICNYYRAVGEEDRAVMLEKRMKRLMEQAERGAERGF